MAKIKVYSGKYPKRIGDYIVYPLGDELIVRQKSGFTTKGLLTSPKYALCRQNASEFGLVSTTCKAIRGVLADFLTKHNNLMVVNSLTKKMRSLLVYDETHPRGARLLQTAFASNAAQQAISGYFFNPDCRLTVTVVAGNVSILVPEDLLNATGIYLGCSVLYLFFDFETLTGHLDTSTWQMEKLHTAISFGVPDAIPDGCWLRLVALSFFSETDGEWLPILPEEKGLVVL
jgi:hypothetical protein